MGLHHGGEPVIVVRRSTILFCFLGTKVFAMSQGATYRIFFVALLLLCLTPGCSDTSSDNNSGNDGDADVSSEDASDAANDDSGAMDVVDGEDMEDTSEDSSLDTTDTDAQGVASGQPCPDDCPPLASDFTGASPCDGCAGGTCYYEQGDGYCSEECSSTEDCQDIREASTCESTPIGDFCTSGL